MMITDINHEQKKRMLTLASQAYLLFDDLYLH